MTAPISTTVANPSKGYTLVINHHPGLDPFDFAAFYQIGQIEVGVGNPTLTIDLPPTADLPDEPIITVERLVISGSSSHIKAQKNTQIKVFSMELSDSTLESVQLMARGASIVDSVLKNLEMEPGILSQINVHSSTFIYGGVSYRFRGRYLDKFAILTLDGAYIVGNYDRRIFLESSVRGTKVSFEHQDIFAESEETVQSMILLADNPVITLPYGSGLGRGTLSYRSVYDVHGAQHLLVTYEGPLNNVCGAFYSLDTIARELEKGRYLALSYDFVFRPRSYNKTAFDNMVHVVELMKHSVAV